MIRLLGVELTRLRLRRAVVVLCGLAIVVPVLIAAATLWEGRPIDARDRAEAERQVAESLAFAEEDVARCEEDPEDWGLGPDADPGECFDVVIGDPSFYTADNYLWRTPLDVGQERTNTGVAVVVVLAIALMLVGATFAGSDWATGSLSVQLLTDPRRGRVWLAKGLAVGLLAALLATVVLTLYWSALGGAAAAWDLSPPDGVWGDVVTSALAGVVLVTGAAVTLYALTMLLRSTVGALGVLVAASVGSTLVPALLPVAAPERWILPSQVYAFVTGRFEYYDPSREPCGAVYEDCVSAVGRGDATAYLLVVMVVVLALSVWSFRRRDVP
ncbi:ABC transporter permease subunit [Nocardioides zeae]|uniref:ABC transporter permease subunit n=1 Tax=Nocardioides imazamoxiresistens TaxID=3231893 RepID=A0ABU3PUU5_9ACTN|nr:ABC transporter permease subunit [Nocardioides zeae]MDT9592617.1 ABC transporter permease subunit [Nocardioides zeae]